MSQALFLVSLRAFLFCVLAFLPFSTANALSLSEYPSFSFMQSLMIVSFPLIGLCMAVIGAFYQRRHSLEGITFAGFVLVCVLLPVLVPLFFAVFGVPSLLVFFIIGSLSFLYLHFLFHLLCFEGKLDAVLLTIMGILILVLVSADAPETGIYANRWIELGVAITVASLLCIISHKKTPRKSIIPVICLSSIAMMVSLGLIGFSTFFFIGFGIIIASVGLYCLYLCTAKPEGSVTTMTVAFAGLATGLLAIHFGMFLAG